MTSPRVAVQPVGPRPWVADAIVDGGGTIADPAEADGLVWTCATDPRGPSRLAELLRSHPHLRWVQLPFAGVETYTGVFDHERTWTSGKGVYARPVAEHALMLALAGLRDLKRFVTARSWGADAGVSLFDGAVTIFGGGGIARELVALLRPFGCHIKVVRRGDEPLPGADETLPFPQRYEALHGADVVFLALALTPETDAMIGEVELELMEPHAWLVNVARGRHVVTDELVVALRDDVIGGAGLDVADPEPLPDGHPLWDLPNCLVTPHTANTGDMEVALLSRRIAENVRRLASGDPLLGVVDPDAGY